MASESSLKAWMVTDAFGVGSEVWMYRQACMLKSLDLTVMTYRHHNRDRYPANGFDVQLVKGRWRLPRTQRVRDLCLETLAKFNRRVPGFSASTGETNWWLERLARDRPEVCLAQFGTAAVQVLPLMEFAGIPLVAHFHGYDLTSWLSKARYRNQLRRSADRIAAYVVVANYMKDVLVDLGVSSGQIHVIPCGVPIPEEVARPTNANRPCRFLSVGRFVDKKRPDLTVRAFSEAARSRPGISLKMIGDGPLLRQCQQLSDSLLGNGRIEFAGSQPQGVVQQSLMDADAFVQHSVIAKDGNKEGWPVAIAEAAAAGLPVVATNHASIPEQIEHGVAGLLCDELDWRTMGDHIGRLADEQHLRLTMGKAARKAIASYAAENQVRDLQRVMINASKA